MVSIRARCTQTSWLASLPKKAPAAVEVKSATNRKAKSMKSLVENYGVQHGFKLAPATWAIRVGWRLFRFTWRCLSRFGRGVMEKRGGGDAMRPSPSTAPQRLRVPLGLQIGAVCLDYMLIPGKRVLARAIEGSISPANRICVDIAVAFAAL